MVKIEVGYERLSISQIVSLETICLRARESLPDVFSAHRISPYWDVKSIALAHSRQPKVTIEEKLNITLV